MTPGSKLHPVAVPISLAMERIRDPEIVPLEVGDLLVDGAGIRDRIIDWGFAPTLRRAIQIVHAGLGATRSNGPLPSSAAGFEAVLLTGGRAREDELREGLFDLPCELHFGDAGVFAGMSGGFALLERRALSGWVLDLGQTQLKIATRKRLWTYPRDFDRLRAKSEIAPREVPAQRRRLREFIALHLQLVRIDDGSPQALVFALPARLAADGTPGTSDYAGLRSYREFIPDALELAGFGGLPAFVLNDAELAGFSARADPRLADFGKILVLTLGFGIGAALVCRPR